MIKYLIYIFLLSLALSASEIKNVYILIEPTSIQNRVDYKNKEVNDILKETERIVTDIILASKKKHVKNIYVSRIWKKFKHHSPILLKQKDNVRIFLKKVLKPLYKYHNYNIAKILGDIHSDFEDTIDPKESMIIYIGDVNYMNSFMNSSRGYLNSGWLVNKQSIFVNKFLKQDNSALKGVPIFIINRVQLPLAYEERKEKFIIKLFNLAGLTPVYIGVNPRIISSLVQKNYIVQIFENQLNGFKRVESNLKLDDTICQIVTPGNAEVPVPYCGGKR
jgi:hypothetical protein